ncbi:DUF3419 family protein [Rhodocytophaga aerolata]|uniref:DUF3419 family protein n=1 Tax=Rhodocytophaga aerolata TaxID=455078 RepID=A0ABT8R2U0_9BACT|nr:DUF3419 family protein [Rhodocytophaga aerolata]MDO1445092.1 DUF3419 family protein [Rhodocytophaga aerolata]
MTTTRKDQVGLNKLIFTLNWEDPASDKAALQIRPGDKVMTITSGGCNTFELLLEGPDKLYAVDINPAQSWLMELKKAAIVQLEYQEFMAFMGLEENNTRIKIFEKLQPHLSPEALYYWQLNQQLLEKGLLMSGRFEKFVQLAGRLMRILQGNRTVHQVFEASTPAQQQQYYDQKFDTWQFRLLFKLLFNKRILAKRGLSADYFYFDDGSRSFAESFYRRARHVLRDLPTQPNYFLSLYLLGKYHNLEQVPAYLKEENFSKVKSLIHRLNIITADVKVWLQSMPESSVDCFSLSNICELKSEEDTALLFEEIARVATPGARCLFRNLIIPREVPVALQQTIRKNETLSTQLLQQDRSFVYGKVAGYTVSK